jgi:uncharacterized protein (DUF302 family)
MKLFSLALASLALAACTTMAPPENPQGVHGMIAIKSAHSAKVTMDRYEAAVKAASMNVFARVDHAAGAQRIGKSLRPTEVLIWGSPQAGTPMLECSQTVGIDLPQKALVWQDAGGDVYLGWNDPVHLVTNRHETKGCEGVTTAIARALAGFAKQATQ